MRLIAYLLAVLAVIAGVLAVDVQKQVIISYPEDTPDNVVEKAKQAIVDAGGIITHEYQLIKGFAATAGEKVLETVQSWGEKYNALVEEDQVVSISSGRSS